MEILYIPPPARMGLLVAAKYARAGYAIRRAIWHGGVTLQNPTPTDPEIAAAHALAWVTYAPGLYSYAEPATPLSHVALDLDALLADYEAADWTTLAPEASNDDVLDPNYVPVITGGTEGAGRTIGGFTLTLRASEGGGGDGGGGGSGVADTGSSSRDCGTGMYWDGTKCRTRTKAGTQPTITIETANLTSDLCTLDDPVTNEFGVTAKVNDWTGAKAGDIWFITIRHGSPGGLVTGARGAKAVGAELTDSFELTGSTGQTYTVFVTAWLAGGNGLTVTAQKTISLQALCACVSSSAQIQVVLSGVTLRPCAGGGAETRLVTALDGTYTLSWNGYSWSYEFTVDYQLYTVGCVPSGAPFAVDAVMSVTCTDGSYSLSLAGDGHGPYFQASGSSAVPLALVLSNELDEPFGADAYDGTATLSVES